MGVDRSAAQTRKLVDSWHGPYFVTVALGGIVVALGWQWGDYQAWREFPIKVCRRRGR